MSNEPTSDRSDELAYGGVCPVCGDEFTDGWVRFENLKDESVEGVRLCVISPPDDVLLHLPEDQDDTADLSFGRRALRMYYEGRLTEDQILRLFSEDQQEQEREAATVTGEVVDTRSIDHQERDFDRAVLNKLSFRGLEGGTYKLVKVDDSTSDS